MKDDNVTSIVLYGIGGQGNVKASEVCGLAALLSGYHVKKTEVHGMSQRGGSVESYIRFGKKVFSPLPADGTVDILICLHEEEYPRLIHQLKKDGIDLFPYLAKAKEAVGEQKLFLNTFMLGVLSAFLPIKTEHWLNALNQTFKYAQEENKNFFLKGKHSGEQK
ncbi:MAG TPA: 2-oxoacid:acceptor oxidoreductase family protein [Candidatus Omnitrophota bacterium]|nr:2-oxoacid:acceptor oxidoreductase family protein [Candidatus Omnitrophota bacterium]